MTLGDAAALGMTVHGAVWLAAIAGYLKFGDSTELVEKSQNGNRTAKRLIRDRIAADFRERIRPVIRESADVRSPVLDAAGAYIEHAGDVTASERFHDAVRDFVALSAGPLVDYKALLAACACWDKWLLRLRTSILWLLIMELALLGGWLVARLNFDGLTTARTWWSLSTLAPTGLVAAFALLSLAAMHRQHSVIAGTRRQYDPEA